MRVLGIETSCDETSAAVIDYEAGSAQVRSNLIYSQIALHAPHGGIVPELASRKHIETIAVIVRRALEEAGCTLEEIDAVAVTKGPGLIGALLVGVNYAKALAWARKLPLIGVNHVEAHLMSMLIEKPELARGPFLGLVVSGGHTSLFHVRALGEYALLGATRDDAVGEAFDKVAKLLGLGYPGGPLIDKLAREGNERAVHFPRAVVKDDPLAFSFSGLKTAVRLEVERRGGLPALSTKDTADLAASFQWAAVRAVLLKAQRALDEHHLSDLAITGGVAANSRLRAECELFGKEHGMRAHFPSLKYCTDNAAMIAALGARQLEAGERDGHTLAAVSRLPVVRAA